MANQVEGEIEKGIMYKKGRRTSITNTLYF